MENPNISDGNPVTNEMQVNLHMLRLLMLNRVGGEVHGNNVVAIDKCGLGEQVAELT
jgi:microcompartment protein CcmK/EutM